MSFRENISFNEAYETYLCGSGLRNSLNTQVFSLFFTFFRNDRRTYI